MLVFCALILIPVFYCKQSLNPPVLVFVQNKERAKELYNELKFDNIRADVIHADLSQIQVIYVKYLFYVNCYIDAC